MKTVLIGYDNDRASGLATLVAGPEVPTSDQNRLLSEFKAANSYPEGIVRIDFCELKLKAIGIKIGSIPGKPVEHQKPKPERKMKKFLSAILIVAALALAIPSNAQPVYSPQTLGTVLVVGSTATNVNYVIDCRKQESVGVGLINRQSGSDTSALTLYYARSIDGVTYSPITVAALTPVASTTTLQITNLATLGCGYIKITHLTNAAAGSITATNTLQYGIKIP